MRILVALLIAVAFCLARAPTPLGAGAPVEPRIHKGNGWAIAAPADWDVFRAIRPPMVLYLIGDSSACVPLVDGTLSPIKAGLTVEVGPKAEISLKERIARDVKELKESKAFRPLAEPTTTDVKLADGTAATLLDVEFLRLENGRVSFQSKVYAEDPQGGHVVGTSFLTSSRPGRLSLKSTGLPEMLRAHALSLVLSPDKLDVAPLKVTYAKHNWNAASALDKTAEGNKLIAQNQFPAAAKAFRDAIQIWNELPAAHNGLAWALLHTETATPKDLEEAVREARSAVKLTEELDYSALDTLSLALYRSGDKDQAIKTIKEALELQPKNPELLARLRSFE